MCVAVKDGSAGSNHINFFKVSSQVLMPISWLSFKKQPGVKHCLSL